MDLSKFDPDALVASLRARADAHTEADVTAYEQQRHQADRRNRLEVLRQWQVPQRTLRHLGKRLQETEPLGAVRSWAPTDSWCLVLSSRPGTGKSVAAASWLLEQSAGTRTSGASVPRWVSGVKLARADGFSGELDALAGAGPLVVDDLGVEYSDRNGAFQSKLDGLLDERYANFRKTLVTTNLTAAQFRERYGERVADRIREGGVFVEFREPSMRGQP